MGRGYIFFVFLLIHSALAKKHPGIKLPEQPVQPLKKWLTLSGDKPEVVARGGYSGLFPDSSSLAYELGEGVTLPHTVFYCDLQLSKDSVGFCLRDIRLDNNTDIDTIFPKDKKFYDVNGKKVEGWFLIDYTAEDLFRSNTSLKQNDYTRSPVFDFMLPPATVDDVAGLIKPNRLWLNVEHDMFYKLHKLEPEQYILDTERQMRYSFISSPEIGFLKSIGGKINKSKTKLIFKFLNATAIEPTTKKEYGLILKDLASIKTFASGILVPKDYIWPVDAKRYLMPHTSLVLDAHKLGLELYASGFRNDDKLASYNYSYNPIAEYLEFIDACFAQNRDNKPAKGALIISHNGASGLYPGSSDLAYQRAVDDGADVIDCSVQMSSDGVAYCLPSVDLSGDTTATTTYLPRAKTIPEIQPKAGIFSFELTASEIQGLKPELPTPEETSLPRNPENRNKGKFITLSEFLDLAKAKAVSGILINIENAPYLASNKGISITDVVAKALVNATFDKQVTQQVFIESDDTSVLSSFKNVSSYKKIFNIKEIIGSVAKESLEEIKKVADGVMLRRQSIITDKLGFSVGTTDVIKTMKSANISTYVGVLRNEFTVIPLDFDADPTLELAVYINHMHVDGIVTDYPATASAYKRSPCFNPNASPAYGFGISPAEPGQLINSIIQSKDILALAPVPALTPKDVIDPPLPPVVENVVKSTVPATAPSPSGQPANAANLGLCLSLMMVLGFLSLGFYQ
ncbi:Suppressor of npr1-1 [Thalictrum thalictroides]|uniref:glycerophosphodiester phosphodiesterase n=1 Tax=Thalictrum thalictroides TaxID=46969 RepID=A0A7J6VT48_THATH|nr:Suppressor of npr1-1 [Thalictrum thalictroides]